MIRFLAGVVIGTLGTMHLISLALPATPSCTCRDPIQPETIGSYTAHVGRTDDAPTTSFPT